jgi:hypothetical protein
MGPQRGAFPSSVGQHREFHCFFPAWMVRRSSASHLDFITETSTETVRENREKKMKRFLKLSAAPIAALSALALVATATPASADRP